MKNKVIKISQKLLLIGLFMTAALAGSASAAGKVRHAIIGSVKAVDKTAKTVVVKTADGTVETVKWTGKTTVNGLKGGAKAASFVGREGSYVVIHYTTKGVKKTADAFEYIGSETPKVVVGTVKVTGKGAKQVVVKTGDGAKTVLDLSERTVVDTGKGTAIASKVVAKGTLDGAKVTVHYTEKGGRKVAHFIKRL